MPVLYEPGPPAASPENKPGGSTYSSQVPAAASTPKKKKAPSAGAVSRRINNNGGGGGYSSPTPKPAPSAPISGGIKQGKPPAKPATPAKPKLPTFDQWAMKDSAYQQALADYNLAVSQYQTTHDNNVSMAEQDRSNQLNDWQTQYDRGLQGLLDDFAARGLGNSGLYADAQTKYTSDAEAQKQALMDAILRRITGEDQALTDNNTAAQQALQQAKQLAAQRGAGQFSGTV